MTFQVTVQPSGKTFSVEPNEKILEAALRQGVILPYGCQNGACGSCKGDVVEGSVVHGEHAEKALSAEEEASGKALFCCCTTDANLVIHAKVIDGVAGIQIKKLPARVESIEKVSSDVIVLTLQLPATEKFEFLAGQYIELILKDNVRRSYSMANPDSAHGKIELHIRHLPGGLFTDSLFGVSATPIREKGILRFEGPLGTFFLRDGDKPMILLASGTGFAPIKALVENMIAKGIQRPTTLYWGGRRPEDIYMMDLAKSWEGQLPNFTFIPVVSDAFAEDQWEGRTGFVHQAVVDDFADLSGYQVYACGAPIVVDSAKRDFVAKCKLPEDEFYADSFTSAADA